MLTLLLLKLLGNPNNLLWGYEKKLPLHSHHLVAMGANNNNDALKQYNKVFQKVYKQTL
jgi:hypothetical protein